MFLHSIEIRCNGLERNYDGRMKSNKLLSTFSHAGRPLETAKYLDLDTLEKEWVSVYALKNWKEKQPFFRY